MGKVDHVLVSVLAHAFKSITDEMSISLAKTTRSPILCEARDFVTGLYDAQGRMLEQTENLPILAFSLGPVCKHIVRFFGDDIHPGDVIFHNDVFSLGNQNNDVAVFKPLFFQDKLVAWSACKGHQADIGGAVAGGYNPNATEVWQEALRIPAVKVYERGKLRKDVWNLLFANIRYPIVEEDMRAEIGSTVVGERRLLQLLEKHGLECFESHKAALFESTRKMMQAEIASIPDGEYSGEANVYYDGRNEGSRYKIRVTITVKGDRIKFDYSRTDPQTTGFVNGTYTSSASATALTFLQMVNPDIPHNEGMIEPLEIVIPEGTLLNASYPKATTFGNHLCPPNADAIIRALAPAIGDRVTAGWNQLLCSLTAGEDPRSKSRYVDICFMGLKGGSGAVKGADGYDHIGMIDASGGVLDQDYEMFEQQTPHRLIRHEYARDSAGPGQWRGGLGVETVFEIGSDNTQLVVFGDGDFEPAFGLFGGGEGALNSIRIEYPDGTVVTPKNKDLILGVQKGSRYFQVAGGGGGYGDPRLRPAELVRQDVRNGVLSREAARRGYGVVVDENLRLDPRATAKLRAGSLPLLGGGQAREMGAVPTRPPPRRGRGATSAAAREQGMFLAEGLAAAGAIPSMDGEKRLRILADIMRASHFEWRRASLALSPGLDPAALLKRYWEEVGKDTAAYYLKKIDPSQDVAAQVAGLFVSSSKIMGENAQLLGKNPEGRWRVRHDDCPWFHWHKRQNLLAEDLPGCERFLETVVTQIGAALRIRLRFRTLGSLPGGGKSCLRLFWVEPERP